MSDQDELRDARRPGRRLAAGRDRCVRGRPRPCDRSARRNSQTAVAYLELHIEQGPVLESLDLPLGAVLGTFGVERHRITWTGQAAHAGSTPMDARRDALAGAAKLVARDPRHRPRDGRRRGVHLGRRRLQARDRDLGRRDRASSSSTSGTSTRTKLAAMLERAQGSRASASRSRRASTWRGSGSGRSSRSSSIATLIELCDEAVREVAGTSHRLPSGPLHDAAEVSRAGVPTVMLFVQSLRGLSHTKLEDTRRGASRARRRRTRPARRQDDRPRRRTRVGLS